MERALELSILNHLYTTSYEFVRSGDSAAKGVDTKQSGSPKIKVTEADYDWF